MPDPEPTPSLTEADAATLRAALLDLVALGTELARDIVAARKSGDITPDAAAQAFERVARATRRTVLLATRLGDTPAPSLVARRREVIRTVEDHITREERAPTPEAKARLEREFRERLDTPEFAEDLAARPVAEIVRDILRDMDLDRPPFTSGPHFRRRTPDAVRRLHALARGEPSPLRDPNPPPPSPDPDPSPDLVALHRHILEAAAPPA